MSTAEDDALNSQIRIKPSFYFRFRKTVFSPLEKVFEILSLEKDQGFHVSETFFLE